MMHRGNLSADERQIRSKLIKIIGQKRILRAGIVKMSRKCGKANCHCIQGKKHVSYYLSMRVGKKRKMVYVQGDMEGKAREWVANYKEINKAIDQLTGHSLEQLKRG